MGEPDSDADSRYVYYKDNDNYDFEIENDVVTVFAYEPNCAGISDIHYTDDRSILKMFNVTPNSAMTKDDDNSQVLYDNVTDKIDNIYMAVDKKAKTLIEIEFRY